MAKLNVKFTAESAEYNGDKYVKVDRKAQVGDLVRATQDNEDETAGAFYLIYDIDCDGDPVFRDDADETNYAIDADYEVYEKCCGNSATLKVGDLAKVIGGFSDHSFANEGIVKLIEDDGTNRLKYEEIGGNKTQWVHTRDVEPYTPTAGDTLTIDGTTYTLRDRKAKEGEKVLVIKAETAFGKYENYDVFEAESVNLHGITNNSVETDGNKTGLICDREYLVLEPAATVEWISAEDSEDASSSITFIVRNYNGKEYEITDDVVLDVQDLVNSYLDDETHTFRHPQLFIQSRFIESITVKEGE
jgi:hypothetical protein